MAGWMAADHARQGGMNVIVADMGFIGKCGQSPYATAMYVFDTENGRSVSDVVDYVHRSGEYITNKKWSEIDISESNKIYEELKSWGIEFHSTLRPESSMEAELMADRSQGFKNSAKFSDTYGESFGATARKHLLGTGVKLLDRVMITNLILQDGRASGAVGFSEDDGQFYVIEAGAVIMCTGGCGMKAPGYPMVAVSTGDGERMAFEAGADLLGKEFPQPMRSTAENPAILRGRKIRPDTPLGDGSVTRGVLFPGQWSSGEEKFEERGEKTSGYMLSYLDHELAFHEVQGPITYSQDGDTYHVTSGAALGMAIRKSDGIWPADYECRTSVPGLYAAGDSLGTMQNGAVYTLVGGSIEGCAATGAIAGDSAARDINGYSAASPSEEAIRCALEKAEAPLKRKNGYSAAWIVKLVQNLFMPYYISYIKKADRLESALVQLDFIKEHLLPSVMASNTHELRLAHEAASIVLTTEIRLRTSLMRTESRGMHFREDFPYRDDENWLAWIKVRNEDNGIQLEKVPVPEDWRPPQGLSYAEKYPYVFPGEEERGLR